MTYISAFCLKAECWNVRPTGALSKGILAKEFVMVHATCATKYQYKPPVAPPMLASSSSSSSSSDRVDSRLRQPTVATTTSLGPFSTNAEGCTVADLLDPWMARASWPSPPTRTKTRAVADATCDNARWAGVWSSSLTTWPNNEFRLLALNTGKVGPVDNFCVSDKFMPAYPEDHTLGTHVEETSSFRRSSCRSVHVSEPYNRLDRIVKWCKHKQRGTPDIGDSLEPTP